MPRSSQVLVENNFTRGLITEATAMAFPENAVAEIDNCDISTRGVVTRRLGFDYEDNYVVIAKSAITANTGAISEYLWSTVGGNGTVVLLVQQMAEKLIFFTVDSTGISQDQKAFEVDMLDYKVAAWTDAEVYQSDCSFSSGADYLYVTNPYCEPIAIQYNIGTDAITVTTITLEIRDLAGVEDGLEIDERPASISDEHKYNLYNQGWGAVNDTVAGNMVVFDYWDGARADYPANSDVFWLYRDASETVTTADIDEVYPGNSYAPKGHYIFNPFNVDRNSIIATVENDTTDARPMTVAFYAGRTWFSGVQDLDYSSNVYYSQIVQSISDVGKCYQSNDPTSETTFDIVDSDGGVIKIAEAGRILKLAPFNAGLVVLADNGIWVIAGSDNGPFTPTNYSITKISDSGALSHMTVSSVEGLPVWVSNEGIFTIRIGDVSRAPEIVSITKETIQDYFDAIPKANLPYMKASYNSVEKRVIWLFRSTPISTFADRYIYDKLLVLNRSNGAFFIYTPASTGVPKLAGLIVVDGIDQSGKLTKVHKFVTTGLIGTASASGLTYSQIINTSLIDWYTYNTTGIAYSSYFITGYRVRGELLKKFQSNYLMVLTGDEASGSCLVQGIWDYSNTTSNGRYTTSQEVYRPDSTYNYHRCKLKIRGNGYSLQFKFRSNGNNPFQLIGWATFETANNVP